MSTSEAIAPYCSSYSKYGKRLFDIFFSSITLILGIPFFFILALLVKISSRGPIFYKGLRIGQGGKLFYCWKFRTMCVDAEEKLNALLLENPKLLEEWTQYHKLKCDPRLTKLGKFLRKSSLDELPQFWNVLKGDLSVVGPRPLAVQSRKNASLEIQEKYGNKTHKILSVKPGVTCIWQTCGRNKLTLDTRAKLEEEYVDFQSFRLDLSLIFKTIYILLTAKGAY